MTLLEMIAAHKCERLEFRPPHGIRHNHPCCLRSGKNGVRCTSSDTVVGTVYDSIMKEDFPERYDDLAREVALTIDAAAPTIQED